MKKKYFIYLILVLLIGCKTGGPEIPVTPEMNQSVVTAFSKMIADKQFSSQGGTTFSENEGTKFTFTNQDGVTFSGSSTSNCNSVKSDVKIDGVATYFKPATCELQEVGYYVNGQYFSIGNYYFIWAFKADERVAIVFTFKGGRPQSGTYKLGYGVVDGAYETLDPSSSGTVTAGSYSTLYGDITVNTESGFILSSTNLWGWNTFSLRIGCCSR